MRGYQTSKGAGISTAYRVETPPHPASPPKPRARSKKGSGLMVLSPTSGASDMKGALPYLTFETYFFATLGTIGLVPLKSYTICSCRMVSPFGLAKKTLV